MNRRKPIRKKRLMNSDIDKARALCEIAWKEAVKRRDKVCQVHGPSCSGGPLQVDHFQSRTHQMTFFDERNGTLVCAGANRAKAMGWHNMGYAIGKIVERREGEKIAQHLIKISTQPKKWTIEDLEIQTKYLNCLWQNARPYLKG